jgi:hypothetical protein
MRKIINKNPLDLKLTMSFILRDIIVRFLRNVRRISFSFLASCTEIKYRVLKAVSMVVSVMFCTIRVRKRSTQCSTSVWKRRPKWQTDSWILISRKQETWLSRIQQEDYGFQHRMFNAQTPFVRSPKNSTARSILKRNTPPTKARFKTCPLSSWDYIITKFK